MTRSQDNPPLDTSLAGMAVRLQQLNQRAVTEYTPVVEAILRSNDSDVGHIERTLDGLLDFCGNDEILSLYRRLCRHYWVIDPVAAAQYVQFYRETWDSGSLPHRRNSHE
jgi:hypothetical protein